MDSSHRIGVWWMLHSQYRGSSCFAISRSAKRLKFEGSVPLEKIDVVRFRRKVKDQWRMERGVLYSCKVKWRDESSLLCARHILKILSRIPVRMPPRSNSLSISVAAYLYSHRIALLLYWTQSASESGDKLWKRQKGFINANRKGKGMRRYESQCKSEIAH